VARIEPGRVVEWRIGGGVAGVGAVAGAAPDRRGTPPIAPELPPPAGETPPADGELRAGEERLPPGPPPAPAPETDDGLGPPPLPAPADLPREDAGGAGADAPAGGSRVFVVENRTSQDLEVLLDGEVVGAVGAGMTERFSDLPGLRFTPSARTASGRGSYPHPEVDLTGRQSFTWIITP
jgi:hypothetical protein